MLVLAYFTSFPGEILAAVSIQLHWTYQYNNNLDFVWDFHVDLKKKYRKKAEKEWMQHFEFLTENRSTDRKECLMNQEELKARFSR
jgi:hypothetical protein